MAGKVDDHTASSVGLASASPSAAGAGFVVRQAVWERRTNLSAWTIGLLLRKGLNVNASRLLFEGLEDRILLDGIPASMIASLPPITYSDSITDDVGDVATASFTLPKFDDQGGLRTLVSVTLDSTTTTTTGTYNVVNVDAFAGTVLMSLDLSVASTVSGTPAFDYANVAGATANQPIAVGQTVSVTLPDYTSGAQQRIVLYPSGDLADFIAAPGDSTILFEITTSSAADHTANVAVNYFNSPLMTYTMSGQVIYEYVETIQYTDETFYGTRRVFEKLPPPRFQPFYSGTAQPGASLTVDVLGLGGELLGSTSTVVDAGGNWAASFYDLSMTGQPHTVSIRQSYTGYTPLTGAGYNLRRYFSPAMLGGAYASERLTVDNVLGNRLARVSMAALYSASASPLSLGMAPYGFEMLPVSASPQGLY